MSNVNNLVMTDGTTTAKIFEFIDLNGACSNIDTLQSVPNINSDLLAILGSSATPADSYRFCVKNFRQKFVVGTQVSYLKNSPVPCSVEIPNESTAGTFRTFLLRISGYVIEIYNNDKIKFIPVEYYKEITPVIFESGTTITNADELKRIYNMLAEGVMPTYKYTDMQIYELQSYMCIKAGQSTPLTSSISDYVKMTHSTSGQLDQLILRFFVYSSNAFTQKSITISFSGSTLNSITVP